jgi:K+-sensing histidine kinase KdpD
MSDRLREGRATDMFKSAASGLGNFFGKSNKTEEPTEQDSSTTNQPSNQSAVKQPSNQNDATTASKQAKGTSADKGGGRVQPKAGLVDVRRATYGKMMLALQTAGITDQQKQKEYAESKGLSIKLDIAEGDYSMKGDETQLGEVVKNLIDNSINYTLEGSIDVYLKVDNHIKMTIKDTGIGISDIDKQKLFKSGGRGADSLKININSTGYGLAFVKGVVEAHKGRVWAESEGPGKGSTFYLELPH